MVVVLAAWVARVARARMEEGLGDWGVRRALAARAVVVRAVARAGARVEVGKAVGKVVATEAGTVAD